MHFDFASLILSRDIRHISLKILPFACASTAFVTIFTAAFLIANTQKDRLHGIRVFLRIHL